MQNSDLVVNTVKTVGGRLLPDSASLAAWLVANAGRLAAVRRAQPGTPRGGYADARLLADALKDAVMTRPVELRPEDAPVLLGLALVGLEECLGQTGGELHALVVPEAP